MADNLDLLFRLKAQNQASPVIRQAQADVTKLTKGVGAEFNALSQVSTQALSRITSSLTNFTGSIPAIGNAVQGLSSEISTLASSSAVAGSEVAALAGPIGLVVIAAGVGITVTSKFAESLFGLASAAGQSEGKLFDLSQQTGVSVETLSALGELAKTTGGNIDSIAQSLVVFQGSMEAAEDPTTKQAKAFDRLNVTVTDTEETLRATLAALANMPEGFEQTNRAAELFGRRGGKQFLAILKESHGDIDRVIRELQKLGLANTENARLADEFNDQLVKVQTALTGLSVSIGTQIIPPILDALKELEKFIKDNQEAFEALGKIARAVTSLLTTAFKGAIVALTPVLKTLEVALDIIVDLYERWAAAVQLLSGRLPEVNANAIPEQPLSAPESGQKLLGLLDKLREQQQKASEFGLKPFDLEEIFGLKKTKAAADPALQLLKQLQAELRNLEGATKLESIAAELLDTKYKDISASLKDQVLLVARLIDQKRAQKKLDDELREAQEKLKREQDEASDAIGNFIRQQAADLDQLRGITKSAADAAEEFINEIAKVPGVLKEADKSWIRFRATLIDSENHLRIIRDLLREVNETTPSFVPDEFELPKTLPIDIGLPPEAEERFKGLDSALQDLGKTLGGLIDASENFKTDFADVVGGGIADLAFAVGDLVHQWVLLGETGPNAMRKLTASVLAGLAAQAAVKAIFQLAEGFAALFFNPAEAAAHFQSAALFGSIAGAAAVAGRSVAGDLFKTSSNSRGGGNERGQGQISTASLERNPGQAPQPFVINVKVQQDRHSIVDVFVDDFRSGGTTRQIVNNDGGPN